MACYIISYDLLAPGRDYKSLNAAIKSYGTWAKITESLWAVVTEDKATAIRDKLSAHLDPNDRLFVVKSGTEAAWRKVICRSEWLKEHL